MGSEVTAPENSPSERFRLVWEISEELLRGGVLESGVVVCGRLAVLERGDGRHRWGISAIGQALGSGYQATPTAENPYETERDWSPFGAAMAFVARVGGENARWALSRARDRRARLSA